MPENLRIELEKPGPNRRKKKKKTLDKQEGVCLFISPARLYREFPQTVSLFK